MFEQHRIASDLRLSEPYVKREYVKACFGAVWWGHAWFDVAEDLRKKTKRILCISPDDVSVVDSKTRAKLLSWPMARVQRWAAPKGAITIDFLSPEGGGGENEVASFQVGHDTPPAPARPPAARGPRLTCLEATLDGTGAGETVRFRNSLAPPSMSASRHHRQTTLRWSRRHSPRFYRSDARLQKRRGRRRRRGVVQPHHKMGPRRRVGGRPTHRQPTNRR